MGYYKPRMYFPERLERICKSLLEESTKDEDKLVWHPRVVKDHRIMPGMDQSTGRIFTWLGKRGVVERRKISGDYLVLNGDVLRSLLKTSFASEADFVEGLQGLTRDK